MIYSHDHRDIIGEKTARHRFARRWFGRSFLNVFISPMHMENFEKHLGGCIKPFHILTPPIDTDFFYPRNTDRDMKSAVNLTGRLVSSKGLENVYKWAVANDDYTISVYTKYFEGTSAKLLAARPNVKIYPSVPYKMLPHIYSQHRFVVHFPVYPEAAGRTLIEGALCGCEPLMNENVGVASFSSKDLPINNRELLKRKLRRNVYKFWYGVVRCFKNKMNIYKAKELRF